jgi:hypothetical protein
MRLLFSAICCILLLGNIAQAQESFNNESVIQLSRAGIGPNVLLAKIASMPCAYDVSTASIVALKSNGVADAVIAAMVDRCAGASNAQGAAEVTSSPTAKRSSGLYIDLGAGGGYDIVKIRPTNASGGRTTGNGSLLFPLRVNLAIPRPSAQLVAKSPQPNFYFYFENDDQKVADFGTSANASAQSPSEFSLVHFKVKNGQREMVVAKQKMFGASIGIDPKDAVQFSVEELGDGVFKVRPMAPLKAGEYAFVLRAGSEAYRIYDFSVP